MNEAVSDILARRRVDPTGLSRAMSISIAIHVSVILFVFVVPREWLTRDHEKPILMTISLGGTPGEKTGGQSSVGARTVEEVAPQPEKPKPVPPAVKPKPDALTVPTKTPMKPPKATELTPTVTSTRPTPSLTGSQIQRGTAVAETGSKSQSTGLTYGGGAGGATVTLDNDFCCNEWVQEMLRRIGVYWNSSQPGTGSTTVVFEVNRDGTFTAPIIEKSSGNVALDLASKLPFRELKLQPLPKEYPSDKLKVHLTFPYAR